MIIVKLEGCVHMNLEYLMNQMINCAKDAGKMMKESHANEVIIKSDSANIVTDMDLAIQSFIIEQLYKVHPQAEVLAEEGVEPSINCSQYFIIDPIDGTTNYAYNFKHSAISIAYIEDNVGKIGVCYDPYLDEMFYGNERDAYLNGNKIYVNHNTLKDSLVICGTSPYRKDLADLTFSRMKDIFLNCRDIRRSGSAVLDLCYLAAGKCDGFYEELLSPWDHAAACIIIKGAGGIILTPGKNYHYQEPIHIIAGCQSNIEDLNQLLNSRKG